MAPELIERIRLLSEDGTPVREVAALCGVSAFAVYRYAPGVRRRRAPRKGNSKGNELWSALAAERERDREMVACRRRGDTYSRIGADYGITPERVRQRLRNYETHTGETVEPPARAAKPPKPPRANMLQRILSRARLVSETGCWHWKGGVHASANGRRHPVLQAATAWGSQFVRRALFNTYRGPLPPKHFVVGTCDDELCINPFHAEAMPTKAYSAPWKTRLMFDC